MVEPIVLVHGGAGDIPDDAINPKLLGVRKSVKTGYQTLISGGSVIDAVQAAVQVMEDDEAFNAGHGSVLNEEGEVEMDAIVMEGKMLKTGAVGAIRNVAHPIDVARLVMEKTPHVLLVGAGAKKFANDQGVPNVPIDYLVTDNARKALEDMMHHGGAATYELGGVGTVGAVAVDAEGHVAVATSTGGTTGKMVGRVGDTPLPGCGGYADDSVGAVSTTGHGESIMKFCLSYEILQRMRQGEPASTATEEACYDMSNKVGNTGGAITLSSSGDIGIGFSAKLMAWAYQRGREVHYGIKHGEDYCEEV